MLSDIHEIESKALKLTPRERAVKSIAASPNTWPILEGDLRRRLTKRFPYNWEVNMNFPEINRITTDPVVMGGKQI